MDPRYYGLIELSLTFFGLVAFAIWQFRSLKRDRATTAERERARAVGPATSEDRAVRTTRDEAS